MNKNFKIVAVISMAVLGIASVFAGATYAYFSAVTSAGENTIEGNTYVFDASINVTSIATGKLIPMKDNLLSTALSQSNVCIDSRGYNACNLYKITLTNYGMAQNLIGYISSTNSTTFATNTLKYQLFTLENDTYTSSSDISYINNSTSNYFKSGDNNISITMEDGSATPTTKDYYLAIWLSDNNNDQPLTQDKSFVGNVTFESINGDKIFAEFTI